MFRLGITENNNSKSLHRGPLKQHYIRTKFHENLLSGSKVISEGQRDIQTDW
jgi:hypothetical protein